MENGKTFSTRDSRVIPHLSTNLARSDLASQFGMGWGACQLGMAERDSQQKTTVLKHFRTTNLYFKLHPTSILAPIKQKSYIYTIFPTFCKIRNH